MEQISLQDKMRIVQELVPGKQITLAHIIANPDPILYEKLGLDPAQNRFRTAIGILTISPMESAVIAADIAMKASGGRVEFVDRFTGTLIVTGSVSEVESAIQSVCEYTEKTLGYAVCPLTRT